MGIERPRTAIALVTKITKAAARSFVMLRRTICKLLLALLPSVLATALLLAWPPEALAPVQSRPMPWELLPLLTTARGGAGGVAWEDGWLPAS